MTSRYHGSNKVLLTEAGALSSEGRKVWAIALSLRLSATMHRKVIHVNFFIFLFFRKRNLRRSPVKVLYPILFSKFSMC